MKILIIQILRLGDALQLTTVAKSLKIRFPEALISVITSSLGKEIFQRQNFIDDVFVLRKEEITRLVRNSTRHSIESAFDYLHKDIEPVLSQEWDWVINLDFSFPSAIIAFLAHGKKTSGFFANENREFISKDKWFHYSLASFPNRKYSLFNWVDINCHIVKAHNIVNSLSFPIEEEEISWAERVIKGFRSEEELIGIHPGASGPYKRWPVKNFIDISKSLNERNKKIVIFGDGSEKEIGMEIEMALGPNVLNLAGVTTLGQTAAVMSECSLVLCNDSGPMHLAAAVGTPVLALFFSTHFVETGPYGENNLVLYPLLDCFPCQGTASCIHKKCLDSIQAEAVLSIIDRRNDLMMRIMDPPSDFPHSVGAVRSRFDPMGFLEWVPAFKTPLTIDTIVRIILKLSFVPFLTDQNIDKNYNIAYIQNLLRFFSLDIDNTEIIELSKRSFPILDTLIFTLNELKNICTEIYKKSSNLKKYSESIAKLGRDLQKMEKAFSMRSTKYFDILIKFIEIAGNNILEDNFRNLAAENIGLYTAVTGLVEKIKENTVIILNLLEKEASSRE